MPEDIGYSESEDSLGNRMDNLQSYVEHLGDRIDFLVSMVIKMNRPNDMMAPPPPLLSRREKLMNLIVNKP